MYVLVEFVKLNQYFEFSMQFKLGTSYEMTKFALYQIIDVNVFAIIFYESRP